MIPAKWLMPNMSAEDDTSRIDEVEVKTCKHGDALLGNKSARLKRHKKDLLADLQALPGLKRQLSATPSWSVWFLSFKYIQFFDILCIY